MNKLLINYELSQMCNIKYLCFYNNAEEVNTYILESIFSKFGSFGLNSLIKFLAFL